MTLPIQKLTLYKHGISVVERNGDLEGNSLRLTFDVTQMNDVLKSLVVYDRAGGQIRNVAYDAPEDRAAKLERGTIHLSDTSSFSDLLRDLRGRQVELTVREGNRTVQGIVVGVELPVMREALTMANNVKDGYLSLQTDGVVQVFNLQDIVSLKILDADAQNDLDFFLRASVTEPQKRSVVFRLSEGQHDMVVRYLAPSPTWRVSYRLVGESDAQDERQALMQGWGIFDNPFDEELENVRVSLVSGMPISFIYDLYTPFTPQRPEVKEEARVAAAPVEMERARRKEARPTAGFAARSMPAPAPMMAMAADSFDEAQESEPVMMQSIGGSTSAGAEGQSQGDLFEYRITTPVTVRRGEAAMVPILMTTIPYRKTYVYNSRKMPRNPMVVLRFNNESDLTLERGPITVIENDSYLGEAIFPFTRPGAEALLAIAVDLGISVTEKPRTQQRTKSISLQKQYLLFEEYRWQEITYEIHNTNKEAVDILIEHPRDHEATLEEDSGTPEETTPNHYRFKVRVPAGPDGHTTYTVRERRLVHRHEGVQNLTYDAIARYLREKWLDQALANGLNAFIEMQAKLQNILVRKNNIDNEKGRLMSTQEQARKNMSGLKDSGDEGALRARYVRQLNESEDQLVALEQQRTALVKEETDLQKRIETFLSELSPGQ